MRRSRSLARGIAARQRCRHRPRFGVRHPHARRFGRRDGRIPAVPRPMRFSPADLCRRPDFRAWPAAADPQRSRRPPRRPDPAPEVAPPITSQRYVIGGDAGGTGPVCSTFSVCRASAPCYRRLALHIRIVDSDVTSQHPVMLGHARASRLSTACRPRREPNNGNPRTADGPDLAPDVSAASASGFFALAGDTWSPIPPPPPGGKHAIARLLPGPFAY
jgi:hypothetical protein